MGKTGFASANSGGRHDLDVVVEHLRIDRRRSLVLPVDEFGRAVGHHVAGEGRGLERGDDLGAVGGGGALDGVGDEQDRVVVHVHLVGEELAFRLDFLFQLKRLGILRVEPVIAVHDVFGGIGKLLDELVGGGGAAEHRVDALGPHPLLLHRAREQDIFVVVVRGYDEVGVLRPDLEHDVVEVAGRRRMRDGLEDFEALRRQLRVEQLGEAGTEQRVFVHDHHRLRRLAGAVVDRGQVVERRLGDDPEAGAEAEGVLEAAGDDAVGDADVDDIGQIVARGGLADRETDRRGITADDAGDLGGVHLLHFRGAAVGRRLGVAGHRIDLGASERLDAAGGIDLLDRQHGADAALLTRIGQCAGHRVQHADLHAGALRAQHGGCGHAAGRRGDGAPCRAGEKAATAERGVLLRHGHVPC